MSTISIIRGSGAHAARLADRLARQGSRITVATTADEARELIATPADVIILTGSGVETSDGDWHLGASKASAVLSWSDAPAAIPTGCLIFDSVDTAHVAKDAGTRITRGGVVLHGPTGARQTMFNEDVEAHLTAFVTSVYDRYEPDTQTLAESWAEVERDLLAAAQSYLKRRRQPLTFGRVIAQRLASAA